MVIELLDELVFGAREAAWPLIRTDLDLSYVEIGILLSVPGVLASLIEPAIGILADIWRRHTLIVGGGIMFALALALAAISSGFVPLLVAFILLYPASGAFVSVSQIALMDHEPERREQNMARWTLAGSLGMVAGPLAVGGALAVGAGWRGLLAAFALVAALIAALIATGLPFSTGQTVFPEASPHDEPRQPTPRHFRDGVRDARHALRDRSVLRWLILLQASDLMLDVLFGFLALYLVDIGGLTAEQAGLGVAIWTGVGLVGDWLLLPVLKRVRGLAVLRVSAVLVLGLYPAFLLANGLGIRFALLGVLGLLNSGWYAILQAQLYDSLPGRSGTVLVVSNVAGLVGSLIPLALSAIAQAADLRVTMWLLIAGQLALIAGLPRQEAPPGSDIRPE